jgi:transcriptional regulator with XRE-family HTH domain
VTAPRDLPRDIGGFIRDLRRNARISLRQLAEQAGVSNPYLSQIERGLRKPSAEVLAQLAGALRVSTPLMYLRAGLLDSRDGQGVLAAIAADDDLTMAQKQSLTQIYETFRRENARGEAETVVPEHTVTPVPVSEPAREQPDRAPAAAPVTVDRPADPPVKRVPRAAKPAAAKRAPARKSATKPSVEVASAEGPGAKENTKERA